jgi:hypothetical protein
MHTVPFVVLLTDRYPLSGSNKALILEAACEEVHNTARFECSRWAPWGGFNSLMWNIFPSEECVSEYKYTNVSLSLQTVFWM